MNPLLIRRRGMPQAGGGGGLLPPGYTQLTSVYGQIGARFLIVPIPYDSVEIEIEAKKSGAIQAYSSFFGNYISENANSIRLICYSTFDGVYANLNTKSAAPVSSSVDVYDWHTYNVKRESSNVILTIDGTPHSLSVTGGYKNNNAVFLNAPSSSGYGPGYTHYKKCVVSYGGVVYRHYIPCIDPNNVVGFYDIIRETFETSTDSNYPFFAEL